jgi:rod shape determining protein RodA
VLMLALSRLDYTRLRALKNVIYALLLLSILAVLGLGHAARGSQRAISLPFFSFQASELGKVLLVVALSAFVVDRARRLSERDTSARVMLAALVPAMFVIAQPDLGSGIVYMVIALTLLFVAGTSWRHLAALLGLGAVALSIMLVAAPAAGVHVLKPYQVARLTAFLHPSANPQKEGYQQVESKIAIGSGQKTGRGPNATQISNGFVPESHTDFIFAAVGERYGFLGAALVLSLYSLLIWRALRILVMAKDLLGSLVAGGVAGMLMFQVFVNVGMTIGIMPITGVTLPLMSYGGSSVITTLLAVGLLQSIYVQGRASAALKGRVPIY